MKTVQVHLIIGTTLNKLILSSAIRCSVALRFNVVNRGGYRYGTRTRTFIFYGYGNLLRMRIS